MLSLRRSVGRLLSTAPVTDAGARTGDPTSTGVPSSRGASAIGSSFPERFRVGAKLGEGGMGVVYRAYDVELASDVAIKSLVGMSPQNLYHLKQEFRALADIRHPNLIELYELFASDRLYFFTMELIVGGDLVSYVRAPS